MTVADKNLHLCSCNGTMPLDAAALARALSLGAAPAVGSALCQRELAGFADGVRGDALVACTQESRLLGEAAEEGGRTHTIRFVNIRENGGWSREARAATPKIAALLAVAALPEPEPVPVVTYRAGRQLLILGPAEAALHWAGVLAPQFAITVLATGRAQGAELPAERAYAVYSGRVAAIRGWLGEFEVEWRQENPIDLDLCTRCNACIRACPEDAIDWSYQIDLDRCRTHRDCVRACGAIGAIDFDRRDTSRTERFDLVLDLQRTPELRMHQPPQGYFAPGSDPLAQAQAATALAGMVGEFEKPRFFAYKPNLCAHSRSRKIGCTQCIDVCSAEAIRPDGDHVHVEPHLCVGCGACSTVCPSGAMTYAFPPLAETGRRLKTLLATYGSAGGQDACVLLHAEDARPVLASLARKHRGLPARVIPFEIEHVASLGIDAWLAVLAYGAVQVAVLMTGAEAPEYREALLRQMAVADAIAQGLGYQGGHFRLVEGDAAAIDEALWGWTPSLGVRQPATFALTNDKRASAFFAVDHLVRHAPVPQAVIALPPRSPFGSIAVNRDACTMCLACVGSCPEAALLDGQETPQLRFIESNCVQCGLCAATCPEGAISLVPRLDVTAAAKSPRILNEGAIFNCVGCGKPLGTERMIGTMLAKLANHAMFADPDALERLKMCGDCRVVDLIKHEKSVDVRHV